MNKIPITVRIKNPDIVDTIEGEIYESLEEAIDNLGTEAILKVLNEDVIRVARCAWRETTIKKLMRKYHE
jgi:hypothetical protein